MRILQLIQKPQLRGAEIFASQLSNHLLAGGHEVVMASLLPGTGQLPFTGKLIRLDRPLNKRLFDLSGWKQLATFICEFKPDIVQANAGDTLKFAVFSKLFFRWKTPIVFRNANKVSDFVNTFPKLVFNKFLVKRVSFVISVSELCRQDFIRTYGIDPSKTAMIPIGVEVSAASNSLSNDVKPIFTSGKVLVHVASFVPEKNHEGLLRIVEQLVQNDKSVKAILIGDGRLRTLIENKVREKSLDKNVFLLGNRHDVLSIMGNANAVVLPSLIEGLPAVILEAMLSQTPVIAYDVGGISEIIKPGVTGWLVKAGDEETFTKSIREALNETDNKISTNAYKLVCEQFDNRAIALRFLKAYEKLSID